MPSAAKLEKRASSNQAESIDNNNCTPIRQALVIIEHKIRNLEKRKTKLESYREIQASGKELSNDQKAAVAKFDEVAQCLEFARELSKQMLQLATISEKEQKKQARKDIITRAQAETAKIREVLIYQDILSNLSSPNIREDFINGTNGAVKLEEEELKTLEKFCIDIEVKRQESPEDPPFTVCAQKAAEYLSLTIDGRPKQYGEMTFENVRKILQNIQECGYFDKKGKVEDNEENKKEEEVEEDVEVNESVSVNESNVEDQEAINNVVLIRQQQPLQNVSTPQPNLTHNVEGTNFPAEAPSAAAVPAPAFPQQSQVTQTNLVGGQIPTQTAQLPRAIITSPITASIGPGQVAQVPPPVAPTTGNPIHFPPTTVRAVEQAYYKQHQYIQQMRPLAEVIGSGNFFFLQDSELDSPDVAPGGFPSSTENQNATNNIVTANVPQQSPNTVPSVMQPHQTKSPQQPVQQGQPKQPSQPQGALQPQIPLPQSTGVAQKTQTSNPPPIPTQTFTNQSFPQVVPPTPIFPPGVQNPDIINPPHQIPVFAAAPLPLPQIVAQQPQVVPQSQGIGSSTNVENPHPQQLPQGNLITGPSGSSMPLPGFSPVVKFSTNNAPMGMHQVSNQLPVQDKFETLQNSQKSITEPKNVNKVDETNDRTKENTNDWDSNEKSHRITSSSNKTEIEGNQWSNDAGKNDWSNTVNQNETNTWNNNQSTDNYNNRGSRNTFTGGNNRIPGGNSSSNRGIRSGSGPPSNGYRARSSNSYQQQQNGRNSGVYFRNNEGGGYFQNQNNNYNSGNKSDSSNNYGGNLNSGNYRSRGSGTNNPMSQPSRLQSGGNRQGIPPSLQNTGPASRGGNNGGINNNANSRTNLGSGGPSNPNANRSVRNSGAGGGGAYGSSRPPNVRQPQQDVNA